MALWLDAVKNEIVLSSASQSHLLISSTTLHLWQSDGLIGIDSAMHTAVYSMKPCEIIVRAAYVKWEDSTVMLLKQS